jgi:hypothetical protein
MNNAALALHSEVQRAFEWWNKKRFGGKLKPCVIVFYPNTPRGQRLGHYLAESWIKGKHKMPELVLYADLCLELGPKEILLTVVHEMIHHWQALFGKPAKRSHNREWHEKAQALGLKTKGPKGATEPGELFLADMKAFKFKGKILFRNVARGSKGTGKMRKWTCPGECNGSVRSGKAEVYLVCGVCGENLEPV